MFDFTLSHAVGALAVTVPDTLPLPAAGQLGTPPDGPAYPPPRNNQ